MRFLRGSSKRRGEFRNRNQNCNTNDVAGETSSPHWCNGNSKRSVLITGGAGFIGTNLADRLLSSGCRVLIYDSLARPGSEINLEWLCQKHGALVRVEKGDVRNFSVVHKVTREADAVFHLAAQVAVTDSLMDPRKDFEVNVGGTFNVLEAIRSLPSPPPLLFTSTNKVYGALPNLKLVRSNDGYLPADSGMAEQGINEQWPLDFCSPYGCSKGAADQYVLDYAHTFNLSVVVFRMSCIYGPHQFGTEDQGWVAHFLLRARDGQAITIYGDGAQVRDVLFVDDLVDAFVMALSSIKKIGGQPFNIGGGAENTLSLLQLVELIAELRGSACPLRFRDWRRGDQRYYVSDTSQFQKVTGWAPTIGVRRGVSSLYRWLSENGARDSAVESKRRAESVDLSRTGVREAAFVRTS